MRISFPLTYTVWMWFLWSFSRAVVFVLPGWGGNNKVEQDDGKPAKTAIHSTGSVSEDGLVFSQFPS